MTGTRFATIGVNAIVGILTARALPVAERGSLALAITVASLLSLAFTAGPDTATLRASRGARLTEAVRLAYRRTLATAAAAAVGVVVVGFLPSGTLLGLSVEEARVALCLAPVLALTQLLGNCVLGSGRAGRWALSTLLSIGVYAVVASAVFLGGSASVVAFTAALGVGYACSALLLVASVSPFRRGGRDAAEMRAQQRAGRATFVPTIVQLLLLRLQLPLLALVSGPAAVGLLSVSLPIAEMLLIAPVAISSVLLPEYHDSAERAGQVLVHARHSMAVTAGCAAALMALTPIVVPWAYGEEYRAAAWPVLVVAPCMAAFAHARVLQSALFARDAFRPVTVASLAALALSIVVQLVLSPHWGQMGAAIAIGTSYVAYSVLLWRSYRRLASA